MFLLYITVLLPVGVIKDDRAHTISYSTLYKPCVYMVMVPFSRYSRLFVKVADFDPTCI